MAVDIEKARARKLRWFHRNKHRISEYVKKNKEKYALYKKRWADANPEKVKDAEQRSKEKHKIKRLERNRSYLRKHAERYRMRNKQLRDGKQRLSAFDAMISLQSQTAAQYSPLPATSARI